MSLMSAWSSAERKELRLDRFQKFPNRSNANRRTQFRLLALQLHAMSTIAAISPRLAQVGLDPILRPRSPSLSRAARTTAAGVAHTQRRLVSASAITSAAASISSLVTGISTTTGTDLANVAFLTRSSTPTLVERGRTIRCSPLRPHSPSRANPYSFEAPSTYAEDQTTKALTTLAQAAQHHARRGADLIIPLPAPFTPPSKAWDISSRPVGLLSSPKLADALSPRLEYGRPRWPTSLAGVAVPRLPTSPITRDSIFAPKPRAASDTFAFIGRRRDVFPTPPTPAPTPKPQAQVEVVKPVQADLSDLIRIRSPSPSLGLFFFPWEGREALRIVADKWGALEDEMCYLEYRIDFAEERRPRINSVHAGFREGVLKVTVPRG
ncbi:hypothetical protein BKA62DRAFT_676639 [Auriculariales sp. MPI-PUGE-AT-0066]|nr:hypothetical protein BKA62DRAFT_676639 [Auriculariales sp. MPI-PUGE-AT-0066]